MQSEIRRVLVRPVTALALARSFPTSSGGRKQIGSTELGLVRLPFLVLIYQRHLYYTYDETAIK